MIKPLKVGTDFSGVGAPEQALKELGIPHTDEFACDKDQYARQTYLANHECKIMYNDITTRDHKEAAGVDLYCFGFPCQAFSLSGLRKGFDDIRGTLIFNSAEYIKYHRPRYFIAENVKGLLSHDKPKRSKAKFGRTFSTILNLFAKTVNGQILMPMYEDNLGYHVFYAVLNSKHYDVPQNRERVFIIGIRDDVDANFLFPTSKKVTKKLKDIMEEAVDEKYFLSEKMLNTFRQEKPGQNFSFEVKDPNGIGQAVTTKYRKETNYVYDEKVLVDGAVSPYSQSSVVYNPEGCSPTIISGTHGYAMGYVTDPFCVAMRGRGEAGKIQQQLEARGDGVTNTITTSQKDNLIVDSAKRIRRLTPLECFRLQGFPDTFVKPGSDTQLYKQAGNSMTVKAMKAILKNLLLK